MSGAAMGQRYSHLSLEERCRLRGLMEMGVSFSEIASRLGRHRSTIQRELERESVEPMAATAPARTSAQHQSLLHFVGQAPWSDERVLAKIRALAASALERHGPVEAWIVDDTALPKKGRRSVGVTRQYSGQLRKQENCQAAVTVSIANRGASLPVAWRLCLPQDWAEDPNFVAATVTARTEKVAA